jgi:hypothetical protein
MSSYLDSADSLLQEISTSGFQWKDTYSISLPLVIALRRCSGIQFAPEVVELFLEVPGDNENDPYSFSTEAEQDVNSMSQRGDY